VLSNDYLSLTVRMSMAHSQPLLALRAVLVIMDLPADSTVLSKCRYSNAVALCTEILVSLGAPIQESLVAELEVLSGTYIDHQDCI